MPKLWKTSPELPRTIELEAVGIKKLETSPAKSLAVLQVAATRESNLREKEETNEERVIIASQELLLSSSEKGSKALEKSFHDKLDSLTGKGLERVVDVDPNVVHELLDESLLERGKAKSNVVPGDKEIPRSRVDHILQLNLKEKRLVV